MKIPWATYGRFESHEEMESLVRNQRNRFRYFKSQPKITIACIYRRDKNIHRTVESLLEQSYPHWELLIVSDGKPDLSFSDERIRFIESSFATSSDAKNAAVMQTKGEWFGLIESGDVLSPVALFEFAYSIDRYKEAVLFYSNEAHWDPEKNEVNDFWSKGAPSWFNLIHFNSIGRGFLIKTSLLHDGIAFQPRHSPDEEQGVFLKISLRGLEWRHIPKYLYYRSDDVLSSVLRRREIAEEHLAVKGFRAYVGMEQARLDIQPIISQPKDHLISVIIPCKDKPEMTLRCLEALAKQVGQVPVEVFLVDNGSTAKSVEVLNRELHRFPFVVRIVDYPKPFNYGNMNNEAIRGYSKGDLILVLNNDVFLEGTRSLDQLAGWALLESTGTVGIRLHYEHEKVQHSGFEAFFGGFSRMVRIGNGQGKDRFAFENHEVFGSTFACCMMKRTTYDRLGGFREIDLANGFGDIAFNFECLRAGLHNLYLGRVRGLHLESVSRGLSYEYWEECSIESEFPDILQRMLREDLGVNRLPAGEDAVMNILRESALGKLRKHAPWLKTVKRTLEKRMRSAPMETQ